MTDKEQKAAARQFVSKWNGKGQEDEDCHKFWIELMEDVLGVDNALQFLAFEKKVRIKGIAASKKIDVYIAVSKVIIEQKSIGVNLDKPQQGHNGQTPYEQAKFYNDNLIYNEKARWIIVSNFNEIRIYDMNDTLADPLVIMLEELPEKLSAFDILKAEKSEHIKIEEKISVKAGILVGKLYDALINGYANPKDEETLHSLNQLCVRLVFCLYAEDAGVFSDNQFYNYLSEFQPKHIRDALIRLFKILDTHKSLRDPDEEPSLLAFPYVNGGLFSDETIRIPQFTEEAKTLLLEEASQGFDWSEISPTIFGAVFESTLESDRRRENGMHYTSVENIHKVIDPLFLDDLRTELAQIKELTQGAAIQRRVAEFQKKLASLKFLDPACGSGNFLTETYLSLRKLENEAICFTQRDSQAAFDLMEDVIKVGINQFYGIEIDHFAVTVARTALWIAESQMKSETEGIIHQNLQHLPLDKIDNIKQANSLRLDWEDIVPKDELDYIMGNPPFAGNARLSEEQYADRDSIFAGKGGELDYVACWYKKAADYIELHNIKCAFVSTNSICQGQQVYPLWKCLMASGIIINFAHRTFQWDSEASAKAHVYCIIVGFSRHKSKSYKIYDSDVVSSVDNINGYLLAAPNVFIEKRRKPLSDVPEVVYGIKPADHGYFILNDNEKMELLREEPSADKWIKPFITAKEFVHGKTRWCLWLVGISPKELNQLKAVKKRVTACQEWRSSQSKTGDAFKLKDTPTLMRPSSKFKGGAFIVLPLHTGEKRKYVPFGFSDNDSIPGNSVSIVPNATLYHFGILMSNVHMAWMRAVCGRLKGDYRYASDIVYNNFPWCSPKDKQKETIEHTAQMILNARAKYPDSSLADLYDETTMPPELRKAHQNNDKAVMQAYGFDVKMSESEIVGELMKMYMRMIKNN